MNTKKRLRELIKNEKLDVTNYFDNPSKKRTPTKDSVVLTLVFQSLPNEPKKDDEFVEYKFGFSIKSVGDNFSKHIGIKKAYERYKSDKYGFRFPINSLKRLYSISMFVGSTFESFNEFCKKNIKNYNELRSIYDDPHKRVNTNLNTVVYQNGDIVITISDLFYCFDGMERDLRNYYYKLNLEYFILQSTIKILESENSAIFINPLKRNKSYMRVKNIINDKLMINDKLLNLINNINDKFTKIIKEFGDGFEK
jgi:hypothetical protein